ncbi:unnamed protein product [marine sediment metagenome]|uniref:Uncharacterized protein n=1 Tax=marine sediment metagenome TaxID=412755 RepID=X1CL72_9ZZZZ
MTRLKWTLLIVAVVTYTSFLGFLIPTQVWEVVDSKQAVADKWREHWTGVFQDHLKRAEDNRIAHQLAFDEQRRKQEKMLKRIEDRVWAIQTPDMERDIELRKQLEELLEK